MAFRWTESGGIVLVGDPAAQWSIAYAISADGATTVGANYYNDLPQAFLSGVDGISRSLSAFPGVATQALAVSGDGSIIVGYIRAFQLVPAPLAALTSADPMSVADDEAFIWDAQHGMRSLKNVLLTEFGFNLNLAGWELRSATGISRNGTVIVGNGINPAGQQEAWVVTIPEPGAAGVLILTSAMTALRRPVRRK